MSDFFSASAIYPPLWILLGFVSGFFAEHAMSEKSKIAWAGAFILLALLAWRSGVQQTRAQVRDHKLIVAIAKKVGVPPDSSPEVIEAAVEDKIAAHDKASAVVKPPSHGH